MAQTNRLYFDNAMNFQLGPTEENPDGQVIVVQQGWNEVPEALKDHPIIKRMKPESEVESSRREAIQAAEKARNEAVAKAEEAYLKSVTEAEAARVEEINKASEERAKKMEEAAEQGLAAYVPHPDPDAARAETLTLAPAMHMIAAAGMAYKGSETVSAAQTRTMGAASGASGPHPAGATGARGAPRT